MDEDGQTIQPEGIVNINAGMIMLTCFLFAGLSAKMRATTSMLVGTVLVVIALAIFGVTNLIGFAVLAMIIFSVGRNAGQPQVQRVPGQHRAAGQEGHVDRLLPGADPDRLDDRGQTRPAALSHLLGQG